MFVQRNGSPLPIFHTDKDRTYLTIEFPIHPVFLEEVGGGVSEKVVDRVTEKVTEKVTENQRKILDAIKGNPNITAPELAKILAISERKTKENIKKLKEKMLLKRIGPDKGGHWEVSSGV